MVSEILGISSSALFLSVTGALVFLLVVPRRLEFLSRSLVRRFVEYFGNVEMDSAPASQSHEH